VATKYKEDILMTLRERWLTLVGVISLIATIIGGFTTTAFDTNERIFFVVIGSMLSVIITGLGEILYRLNPVNNYKEYINQIYEVNLKQQEAENNSENTN